MFHELVDYNRFGEVSEKSGLQTFLYIAGNRIGAERNDRDVRGYRVFSQDF
jgi:hypothetical protein